MLPELTSRVDDAIATALSLPRLTSSAAVREVASTLGRPIVRAFYRWADQHSRHHLGSDINWNRRNSVRSSLFVQYQELEQLQSIIDETSDETETVFPCRGVLTAANLKTRSFLFSVEDADEIHGKFDDAISDTHTATIPAQYIARIRKTSFINYAKDEETARYFLLDLKPVS